MGPWHSSHTALLYMPEGPLFFKFLTVARAPFSKPQSTPPPPPPPPNRPISSSIYVSIKPSLRPLSRPSGWPACLPTVWLRIDPLLCFVWAGFPATDNSHDRAPGRRERPPCVRAARCGSAQVLEAWGGCLLQANGAICGDSRVQADRQDKEGCVWTHRQGTETPGQRWRALRDPRKLQPLVSMGFVMRQYRWKHLYRRRISLLVLLYL